MSTALNSSSEGYQQVFRSMDALLRKDAGCTTELDYTEQSSWLLFLKYLDALETDREQEAILTGKTYSWILDLEYRWSAWAAPIEVNGERDRNRELTGEDLLKFVNEKLFPYLRNFKERAEGADTIEYKIGEIFDEIRNRIASGYNLRDVIDEVDKLRFRSQVEKHELSDLYEVKIKNMGNAGRNGGEYYTPRPLIRAMLAVIDPQVGQTVYDGALGSAGFLCEAFEYMSSKPGLTTSNMTTLQTKTFFGKEKKPLPYVIGIMNMILHGIDAPNVVHVNTLSIPLNSIDEADRYDVILANPPFGGDERSEVQQNFTIRSGETAYLFLQHFIKSLKAGGRAGVVIKDTFLSNTDSASVALRRQLLTECNLHAILVLPSGAFQGTGSGTVVLFFEKGSPTAKIWFYELDPGRKLGKTNPLSDQDLAEFIGFATSDDKAETDHFWCRTAADLDAKTFDLNPQNPSNQGTRAKPLVEVLAEAHKQLASDAHVREAMTSMLDELNSLLEAQDEGEVGESVPLSTLLTLDYGKALPKERRSANGSVPVFGANGVLAWSDDYLAEGPTIIVGRKGSAGRIQLVEGPFWPLDVTYYVKHRAEKVDIFYLRYLLEALNLPSLARGVKPGINRNDVYRLKVRVPSLEAQALLVAQMDRLTQTALMLSESSLRTEVKIAAVRSALMQQSS